MKFNIQFIKIPILLIGLLFGLSVLIVSCQKQQNEVGQEETYKSKKGPQKEEIILVANRAGGSISFIDAISDAVVTTLPIAGSEPMYVVYVPKHDRIYVGDRAQDKVHVIDPASRQVESAIDVGNGVFHMWAGGDGNQLWVNNDIDETTSVIDLNTNNVIQTISIGDKPHDVFVTDDGSKAYVSVFVEGGADKVFMYSTSTFQKTGEQDVGEDPHLFHLSNKNKLYVPCQSPGAVFALDESDLSVISEEAYPGAHGIFGTLNQNTIFVTNLPGAEIYTINTIKDEQIGTPTDSDLIPHNLAVNKKASKLFVTHSGGTANTVSVFDIGPQKGLTFSSTLNVGTNPFGIAYYQRLTNMD